MQTKEAKEKLAAIAESYVGVLEVGHNDGPEVAMIQRAVDNLAAGEPWCMAFCQHCLSVVSTAHKVAHRVARSEHVLTVWSRSPLVLRKTMPERGLIAVWRKNGTSFGHAGIVSRVLPTGYFETVEGNTSPGKHIEREGDGVFEKTHSLKERKITTIGKLSLVGFLDPFC